MIYEREDPPRIKRTNLTTFHYSEDPVFVLTRYTGPQVIFNPLTLAQFLHLEPLPEATPFSVSWFPLLSTLLVPAAHNIHKSVTSPFP